MFPRPVWKPSSGRAFGIMLFFSSNYALFFGELCPKNPELCTNHVNCTIFLGKNFKLCFNNLLSLQIFFGFTFNTKLSIFKVKTREKKLFCHQINRSRALFSFPICDWSYLFQSLCMLYKETRAQVPTASSIECLKCLVDL